DYYCCSYTTSVF
nr:immunoglobulin light chain junction region [Macaca mulatta]